MSAFKLGVLDLLPTKMTVVRVPIAVMKERKAHESFGCTSAEAKLSGLDMLDRRSPTNHSRELQIK